MHGELLRPQLPRPPKGLRIVELWGVDENLLHNEDRLTDAVRQTMTEVELHPVGKATVHPFHDKENDRFGLSYTHILAESHVAGHSYWEEDGHFEMQLATCSPLVNLDPLDRIVHRLFQPSRGGYVHDIPYPMLEQLGRLLPNETFGPPVTYSGLLRTWHVPPFRG